MRSERTGPTVRATANGRAHTCRPENNQQRKYDDFRNEVCAECDSPRATSGIFNVKFDGAPGKTFAGKISVGKSSMAKDYQLDGAFNAKLK